MIDHLVGLGHLEQGASFVTLLPTNGPIRWFARALDLRRLFEPVARRGLAAVRTVQAEPAFKFCDPSLQGCNLRRLRRHQRYQLFSRRLTPRISIRIHRKLHVKLTDEDTNRTLIIDGILMIRDSKSPALVREMLLAYLPEKHRHEAVEEAA